MARKVDTEEERDMRIKAVGDYRVMTGESTRNIAKYFSTTQFKISNVTVKDYLERYKKRYRRFAAIIDEQTKENTPETINDPNVVKRVLQFAKLIISGFTIEEISKKTNTEYWVVYRDLKKRLPLLDKNLSSKIDEILNNRSLENLEKNAKKD